MHLIKVHAAAAKEKENAKQCTDTLLKMQCSALYPFSKEKRRQFLDEVLDLSAQSGDG